MKLVTSANTMHNESCCSWRIRSGGAEEWIVPSLPSLIAVGNESLHSLALHSMSNYVCYSHLEQLK
jgi:hypothetical protein